MFMKSAIPDALLVSARGTMKSASRNETRVLLLPECRRCAFRASALVQIETLFCNGESFRRVLPLPFTLEEHEKCKVCCHQYLLVVFRRGRVDFHSWSTSRNAKRARSRARKPARGGVYPPRKRAGGGEGPTAARGGRPTARNII